MTDLLEEFGLADVPSGAAPPVAPAMGGQDEFGLADSAPMATPSPAPEQSGWGKLGTLISGAGNTIMSGADQANARIVSTGKAVGGLVANAPEIMGQMSDYVTDNYDPTSAAPVGTMMVNGMSRWIEKDPEGATRTVGRGALQTAGGLLFGAFNPMAFPAGMAAGGKLFDKLEKATDKGIGAFFDYNDKDSTDLINETVDNALPPVTTKAAGLAITVPRDFKRGTLFLPAKQAQKVAIASRDGALVSTLGTTRNSAAGRSLNDDLRAALQVYADESDAIWNGVNRAAFEESFARKHPTVAQAEFGKLQANIKNRTAALTEMKEGALTKIDVALQQNPMGDMGRVGSKDLQYADIQKLIQQRDLSALTSSDSAELGNILSSMQDDFFVQSKLLGPDGNPIKIPKDFNLTDANKVLGNYYNRLKQARAFDAAVEQKMVTDPGAIAANENLIFALRKGAAELKEQISAKAAAVAKARPDLNLPEQSIADLNEKIHHLIPIDDAFELFIGEVDTALIPTSPRALAAQGTAPNSLMGELTRPLVEGVTETRANSKVLSSPAAVGERLSLIDQVKSGAISTPGQLSSWDALGGSTGNRVAAGMALQESILAQKRQEMLAEKSKAYKLDLTRYESANYENGEVYLEDPNDQQALIAEMRTSPDVRPSQVARQASHFNNPTTDNRVLAPRKGTRSFQRERRVRLNRGTPNSTRQYGY